MGNVCTSCCKPQDSEREGLINTQAEERRPLADPSHSSYGLNYGRNNAPSLYGGSFVPEQTSATMDVQSRVDRIVKEVERNIVDVNTMDHSRVDPINYSTRQQQYSQARMYSESKFRDRSLLPSATGNPVTLLSAPLPTFDIAGFFKIKDQAASNFAVLSESRQLSGCESIVVPFTVA